jgi:hypothetical protein
LGQFEREGTAAIAGASPGHRATCRWIASPAKAGLRRPRRGGPYSGIGSEAGECRRRIVIRTEGEGIEATVGKRKELIPQQLPAIVEFIVTVQGVWLRI